MTPRVITVSFFCVFCLCKGDFSTGIFCVRSFSESQTISYSADGLSSILLQSDIHTAWAILMSFLLAWHGFMCHLGGFKFVVRGSAVLDHVTLLPVQHHLVDEPAQFLQRHLAARPTRTETTSVPVSMEAARLSKQLSHCLADYMVTSCSHWFQYLPLNTMGAAILDHGGSHVGQTRGMRIECWSLGTKATRPARR